MKFSPLPVRNGLNAVRIILPPLTAESAPVAPVAESSARPGTQPLSGNWDTVASYLFERFPTDSDHERTREKIAAGEIVTIKSEPITMQTSYQPGLMIWMYRDPRPEPEVPFDCTILYQDEDLIVVDKPHFLATLPRGAFVTQSAVVRLRVKLNLPELTPIHRLDRVTAGVLMFSARAQHRGSYQRLFQDRKVRKEYEAVAAIDESLELPLVRRTRIIKNRGELRAFEEPGTANTETLIQLARTVAGRDERGRNLGLYALEPHTGKTHQLRIHLSGLGIPILNDDMYPDITRDSLTDYSRPLQLLARRIHFVDPLSRQERCFESALTLDHDQPVGI